MSLKLKIKEKFFSILEVLPRDVGDKLYHHLQRYSGASSLSIEERISAGHRAYGLLRAIASKADFDFRDSDIIEVGSGWLPLLPYFLLTEGKASRISTFDINAHYDKKKIEALNRAFFDKNELEGMNFRKPWKLPEQVQYFPRTDIIKTELPNAQIVFSRYVLEHVTPNDILRMHQKFKNELPPGSAIVHLISPSDHRAFVNQKLSLQDFLQFSEEEWKKKYSRFDYHNRLRLPQYLKIFKDAGLKPVSINYDRFDQNSEVYKRFKKLKLHSDFKQFSEEEVLAGSINVVLKT